MGNFYTNITLRGPSQEQLVETLTRLRKRTYVSPSINGFTVICEQQCDTQKINIIHSLATSLSARFKCPALAILNHDDDVLWYGLYDQGQAVDEYDSTPGYFEGRSSRPEGGNADKGEPRLTRGSSRPRFARRTRGVTCLFVILVNVTRLAVTARG